MKEILFQEGAGGQDFSEERGIAAEPIQVTYCSIQALI